MPYDATTGRVYAPVSVDDVRMALGLREDEPGAGDVGYLCSHENISNLSLIRPLYYKSDRPGIEPESFANDYVLGNNAVFKPENKKAEVADGLLKDLPCASEFDFENEQASYGYDCCRWGCFVPYVPYTGRIQDVFALRDLYWKRFSPNDDKKDANGLLTTTWYCLAQFDGYLSRLERPATGISATLEYGKIPVCTITPDLTPFKAEDIFAKDGETGNIGAPVSIEAVFGETEGMTYGASYFTKKGTSAKWEHVKSAVGGQVGTTLRDPSNPEFTENPDFSDLRGFQAIVLDKEPLTEVNGAIVIPWVCNKKVTVDAAGLIQVPQGAKFYGLNIDTRFPGYFLPENDNGLRAKVPVVTTCTLTEVGGGTWEIKFAITGVRDSENHIYFLYLDRVLWFSIGNNSYPVTLEETWPEDGRESDGSYALPPGDIFLAEGPLPTRGFRYRFTCNESSSRVNTGKLRVECSDRHFSSRIKIIMDLSPAFGIKDPDDVKLEQLT